MPDWTAYPSVMYLIDMLQLSVVEFGQLNTAVHSLQQSIAKLVDSYSNLPVTTDQLRSASRDDRAFISAQNDSSSKSDDVSRSKASVAPIHKFTSMGKSLVGVADEGIKLYDALGMLPPTMQKAQNGFGVFGLALNMLEGTANLGAAVQVTEGLEAISSILAAAEGVAPALAAVGPVGWTIGGGIAAAAVGAFASNVSNPPQAVHQDPEFIDEGLKNGNAFLKKTKGIEQYAERLAMVAYTKSPAELNAEIDTMKKQFLQQRELHFDYAKSKAHDEVYIHAFVEALAENDKRNDQPIKSVLFDNKVDRENFQKTYDVFHHYPLMVRRPVEETFLEGISNGMPAFQDNLAPIDPLLVRNAKEKDNGLDIADTGDLYLKDMISSFYLNGYDYVQKVHASNLATYADNVLVRKIEGKRWAVFQKQMPQLERDRKIIDFAQLAPKQPDQQAKPDQLGEPRQIILQLNKPMIEHFTIHTAGTSDTLNSLRHKVEEILLEILTSANAIH